MAAAAAAKAAQEDIVKQLEDNVKEKLRTDKHDVETNKYLGELIR